MKYYHDCENSWSGRTRYNKLELPKDRPIYGLAYDINDDTENRRLSCTPILGEISSVNNKFYPYKNGTTEKRKYGHVDYHSRMYADTYEEAVEMYNELVQKRIDKLYTLIEKAEKEKIIIDDKTTYDHIQDRYIKRQIFKNHEES